jgi:hypothetical protein
MLNPINVIVYDAADIYNLYAEKYGEQEAEEAVYQYALRECHPLLENDGIVSLYLPEKEEMAYYNKYRASLAEIIVENSDLNYGDTAYIMY